MKFKLEIDLDGPAFDFDAWGEITAIIQGVSADIAENGLESLLNTQTVINDSENNAVGFYTIEANEVEAE